MIGFRLIGSVMQSVSFFWEGGMRQYALPTVDDAATCGRYLSGENHMYKR